MQLKSTQRVQTTAGKSYFTPKLLCRITRLEGFQYGGFDLELWPWTLKNWKLTQWKTICAEFRENQTCTFRGNKTSVTNKRTNKQTDKQIAICPIGGNNNLCYCYYDASEIDSSRRRAVRWNEFLGSVCHVHRQASTIKYRPTATRLQCVWRMLGVVADAAVGLMRYCQLLDRAKLSSSPSWRWVAYVPYGAHVVELQRYSLSPVYAVVIYRSIKSCFNPVLLVSSCVRRLRTMHASGTLLIRRVGKY